MNKKYIQSFIDRGIYTNEEEVITAALKALIKQQIKKEAEKRMSLEEGEMHVDGYKL